MSNDISNKDKKDWENFLKSEKKIPDKDHNIQTRNEPKKKLIDLHGYTLDEANIVVEKFIFDCFENNISQLIIITGKVLHSENEKNPFLSKELSILKNSVHEYIKKSDACILLGFFNIKMLLRNVFIFRNKFEKLYFHRL